MKNFLQVNRALVAEKNIYFNLNQLPSKNDGGQSCDGNRQSRVMSQSGCSAVDVPMTSYGAPDEHPMSIRSASDGTRWNSRGWKYVAMIFAVLVMSMANIGMAWGATYTWSNCFDNSSDTKNDIDLASKTTNFTSNSGSKTLSYVGGSSCKIGKKTAYLAMGGASTQSSNALSARYFILTAPSANGTISVTFAGTASGNELIRTDNGDYQVIAAATSTTKVSSLLSGLTAGTTKIYIAFTGKCYISSIAWTDADAPEALTTLYSSDYKSSMESSASISVSSGMGEQTGGSGWVSAYSKYYKATSTNKEATITFSPALSLVSDGNDRGKIRIYYGSLGHSLNTTVINDFKINGGSSIGTAYGVIEKEKVHVIEYTIPVGTSTLTTIYNKIAVSNGCLLHVEVLTHSAGGGCTAPNHVDLSSSTDEFGFFGGETINLTAQAYSSEGTGSPIAEANITGYQWKHNGVNIAGATSKTYIKENCTVEDAGDYSCVVSTGATCSTESALYGTKVYVLQNYTGGTTTYNFTRTGSSKAGTVEVTLANNTQYQFKIYAGSTASTDYYMGNNGTISQDISNWDFEGGKDNVKLNSGLGGTFTFSIDYSANGGAPKISVTYPRKTIYMKCGSTWCDASPVFFAHTYGVSNFDVKLTQNTCDATVYQGDIPAYNSKVVFTRQKPGSESIAWSGNDNYWNESQEITLATYDLFTCTGWSDGKGTFSRGTYSPSTFTITFAGNGNTDGSMSSISSIACDADQQITANAFEKTGYTFANWTANVDVKVGGATVSAGSAIANSATIQNVSSDIALTAQWTVKTTTITLDKNNSDASGSTNGSVTATYGSSSLTSLVHATRTGYTQDGYETDGKVLIIKPDGTLNTSKSGYTEGTTWINESSSLTLYARWTANKFNVTHTLSHVTRSSGGQAGENEATYGTEYSVVFAAAAGYTLPATVTVTIGGAAQTAGTGYTWNKGTGTLTIPAAYVTGDIVITVTAEAAVVSYATSIDFEAIIDESGTSAAWKTTMEGRNYTLTQADGSKWSLDGGDSGNKPADKGLKIKETGDNAGKITFTVRANQTVELKVGTLAGTKSGTAKFSTDGGSSYSNITGAATASTGDPVTYTYTGATDKTYVFKTSSASWNILQHIIIGYKITYDKGANGTGTINPMYKTHGTNITLSSSRFTRGGYTQDGWSTSDGGSKVYELGASYTTDAPITLYPHWVEDACTPVAAPTGLNCSGNTSSTLTFGWTKADHASGYTAKLWTNSECSGAASKTQELGDVNSVTFNSLSASTTYYCKVQSKGDGSTYCAEGGITAAQSGTTSAASTLYTVTFNSNDGSAVSPITQASEGASITMPAAPTYASHTFQGWVIGGTTYAAGASYTPTANITAYASWKETCAGGGGSGATLFSQNFNSATEVAYEDRASSKLSITSSSGNNIVGNTAASQFTSITADKKGSTGIAINSASGGNSQSASGIFQAYYNNTGGYWSICKTSDFAATAPTAIKVGMKVWAKVGSSSSAVMANFAVGDGFSDGLTNASPGTSSVHSGFSITNESSMKFAAYNVYNTKIYNTTLTQSSWMALTWVINNTGSALTYDDPKSSETTVNNDCYDLWMGTTLVAHNIAATTAAKNLQNLYIGSPSGKNHEIRLDDISVVDLSPAGSGCYYVTYNGNGAEAGSISDATAHTSGSNVTVLGNTGGSAFTKTGYRFNGWNTSATGNGTAYAAGGTISAISADVTLYAQWVADACSAPAAPTISGTSVRTVGQTITLNAACATGADASTTYTWYKGVDWATAFAALPVQEALTAEEGGRIFDKASCVAGDAGTYWCEASNGDDCEAHNATGFAVTVNAAVEEHIYYYKDANHYSEGTYSNPEGNEAVKKDNQSLSSPWMICNGCKAGVDSVVAHGATYDGKGNHMNAYIKLPTGGDATTKNIKFALTAGYTGTLTMKIGGYENNPTVTLQPLVAGVLGDAIAYTGTVSGVATTENNFGEITWNLTTAGGTYVLTVTSKTGYISQIDMTTSTSATFNVTYNGNGNTGGTVPTDVTDYTPDATVTVAANTGDGKLVKENYTGAGWNTANNGTGTNYVPGSGTFTITANTTLYAHWTQLITLAPGTHGTGTNNAAVSWNGSVLRGFAAHTASGYALQGYYTEPSGGTKVLNADGSFAATNIDGFVTSGKWSNTGAAPTLYAQWEASSLLKWNLKVNVKESSITTLSKESAAPTVIAVANMGNLTNNGSLTITGSAKSALTSKIQAPTSYDANKYMSVQFVVAAGYQLRPSDINVKVQPVDGSCSAKLVLEDNNSVSMEKEQTGISKGNTVTVTMTNTSDKTFTGTVTLKIYVYGSSTGTYRLGTPIEINGSVEATCATPPTFDGLSYDATEYTVGASASAITVTNPENADSYQWYYYTANDRSDATKITVSDETTASFTPSTASAFETRYYWCELTNTACGITIKTPAVGITVRNATTATSVTWSDVKLNDATATPNYGGGNYVLRATVDQSAWTGTLAASMITAPAGITIHHVTTGTDGSDKKYIEFKFDVTTAFDRASNATIDFNLALPEVGSYSALNSVKSVSYEACTEGTGAAGMVYIPLTATQTTAKSEMQYYWETAEAGRVAANYGGSAMSSTNNSTGYQTAEHTFNYYAASTNDKWMFQTYVGGVNKVRVAFYAQGALKSSNLTIKKFLYDTEYFSSQGDREVSIGEVNASQATFAAGENGYIEFTVPEMAANSYAYFVTGSSNMKIYGLVLYTENAGGGGSVATNPAWSDSKEDGFTEVKDQGDANFGYTISTTTNTLGAISYSSSKPSVAAVDPVTGEVTITATGTATQSATITATLARSGCYQGATRTYTVQVTGLSCSDVAGTITTEDLGCDGIKMTLSGYTEGATIQWYKDGAPIADDDDEPNVYTTTAAGRYYAVTQKDCNRTSNTVEVAGSSVSATREVSKWYIKNGRLTPDIKLWTLGKGTHLTSVAWSPDNDDTGLTGAEDIYERDGAVWLTGREPNTNSGEDVSYTLTLMANNGCGANTEFSDASQQITIVHQKNTDKHVLAFVVNGTAKGGFTEGITAAQTTSVDLYNAIAAQFDVQATNIYSTDDEQKLREYYSQYDILCITDYPNTQTKGANSKSYVDAIGALIDIRPILTMEAYVSSLSNWKLKGVSGNPKSPTTRQYTMDLQCKDHEIFNGVTTTKIGEGDEAMYRVTMVDKSQEEYKTLDANYGDGEHKANEGYQYGKKPALQGFTYTEEMSDNDLLPLGLIDDGAGNKLQVGIERQAVMEARMMVLGINSYAMERLAPDGETIVINALKYLMKKNAEDISDCSVYFDGSDKTDPTNWDNELNWGPSYASLPLTHQEVRILKECVVKNGVVARASGIKIIPSGRINHNTDDASGSLTIEPGGALIVDGKVRAAVAPNYFNATPTTPANLAILASADAQGALILDNSEGETQATVQMYSKATTSENTCWQYIGIPMESLRPAQNWFYNAWMMKYTTGTPTGDEALYSWEYIKTYDELNSFNGYALTQEGAKSYWLAGALAETGVRELPLSNAGGNGWNMYANSWTAPINIAAIERSDFVNADATIYLYNTGSHADWDIAGDDAISMETTAAVNTAGQYLSVPVGLAEYVGTATQIPAMQGFFVQGNHASAAGSLTLDYDKVVRTTPTEQMTTPLRAPRRAAASKTEPEHLTMIVQGSSYGDVLHLFRSDEWTDAYDNGYDAHKVYGDDHTPQLAAGSPEEELAVVATDELEGTQIRFRAGTHDSEYTIRFLYNSEDESLYLYDIQEQTYTRVETGASYTFTTSDKNVHTRFVLTRNAPQIATGVGEVPSDQVQGIKAKKLLIEDKMFIMLDGRLYDATGKVVK